MNRIDLDRGQGPINVAMVAQQVTRGKVHEESSLASKCNALAPIFLASTITFTVLSISLEKLEFVADVEMPTGVLAIGRDDLGPTRPILDDGPKQAGMHLDDLVGHMAARLLMEPHADGILAHLLVRDDEGADGIRTLGRKCGRRIFLKIVSICCCI
jgi:hypothetical protein